MRTLVAGLMLALSAFTANADNQLNIGVPRFPKEALRGYVTAVQPPYIYIDGTGYGISPALTVKDANNGFVPWGTLQQGTEIRWVKDSSGLPNKIWIFKQGELDWRSCGLFFC